MINIAIVGVGRMATCHADIILRQRHDITLQGVFDPSDQAIAAFREKRQVKKVYSSLSELANDPEVDAVIVGNYTDQHYQTLIELLEAGKKFIFCEKALVRKLSDGEDLLKRAAAANAKIIVGHHRRYVPAYVKLQAMIAAGALGTIRMARVAYCHSSYNREWNDFFANFERCGGVILDMMSHQFDLLNWYFGAPERVSGDSLMFDRSQPQPADFVSGTLTYKNGVICNIDCSWQRYGEPCDRLEVYGDEGCAVYNNGTEVLHVYRPGEHTEFNFGNPSPYGAQMKAFVGVISGEDIPHVGLIDGFNSTKVALRMIEAVQQKQTLLF